MTGKCTKRVPFEPVKTLVDCTDAELQDELHRRRQAVRRRAIVNRQIRHEFVLKHIDELLHFAPDHCYANCSDERPREPAAECRRCFLLKIQKERYIDDVYDLVLDPHHDPLPQPED